MQSQNITVARLFHGTSSYFLKSILKNGLGSNNIVKDLDIIPTLQIERELCVKAFKHQEEHPFHMTDVTLQHMINQSISCGGFNYRHGTVYFHASHWKAIEHATNYKYGSEILSMTVLCYNYLKQEGIGLPQEILESKIPALDAMSPRPVIIEIQDVPATHLRTENGDDSTESVEKLNALNEKEFEMFAQLYKFELIPQIPTNKLTFYWVDSRNNSLTEISSVELEKIRADTSDNYYTT